MSLNGYRDWFLPSKDQLNLMYQNLPRYGWQFDGDWYWSTKVSDGNEAWCKNFFNDEWTYFNKSLGNYVRAIRAFQDI